MNWMPFDEALPVIFMALMGVSMLVYVVSDGYDLGVGMLMHARHDDEKDVMIASIGPFWDANETWLVLGIGILLIAFPKAHGVVLTALYLPVALMLIGLILRGVAFDFRVKAHDGAQADVGPAFFAGSTLAALSQGWMLGRYVSGFGDGWNYPLFAAAIALCAAGGLRAARRVLAGHEDRGRAAAHGGRTGRRSPGCRWSSAWC